MAPEPKEPELVQQLAERAKNEFAKQTCVCIVAANDLNGHVGSGVLLKTAQGTPFLLTARHLLEDDLQQPHGWRPLLVVAPGVSGQEIPDAGASAHFFPGTHDDGRPVDVAIVTLRSELHELFAPIAASIEVVEPSDNVAPTDLVFLVGMPNYFAFENPEVSKQYMISTITYVTGITGHDKKGRLEVEWSTAEVAVENKPFPLLPDRPELNEISPGKTVRLRGPQGISGGGVWKLRGAAPGELWAPSTHARLIGVPVAYDERKTEYAESAVRWASWVHSVANRIDCGSVL